MNVMSVNWWTSMIVSTLMTMIFIYLIKAATKKFNVPVISTIAESV